MIREIHGVELSGEQMATIRDMLQSEAGKLLMELIASMRKEHDDLARKRLNPVEPLDFQFLQRECHNACSLALEEIQDLPSYPTDTIKRK